MARDIARKAAAVTFEKLPLEAVAKVKLALIDYLSCVFESRELSPSVQAIKLAARAKGDAVVIGTPVWSAAPEAAFANAVMGHGLVREDMHTGSVSHLGVVNFPVLLARTQDNRISGRDLITGAVCGYEAGAAIGRALMDREIVRRFRPTGITGTIGAAVGAARMLELGESAITSALGFAANATVGLNEWPGPGADDMFFHVGFAARNAVTAVELAELGAYASETSLDGAAGLFAALGRLERAADVAAFEGEQLEILSVYHKPAPACNYAQTACQVARLIAQEVRNEDIASIAIQASAAALNYPGCNFNGPFERVLQAKMSIQYCVAATLVRGAIEDANYRLLRDPEVARLIQNTTLVEGRDFTAAYPGMQGTEITVTLRDGRTITRRLDDLVPATADEVRERFRTSCDRVLGETATERIEAAVNRLDQLQDVAVISELLASSDINRGEMNAGAS
ncbi:MAG: MmgE/PrpD family protein [Bryobacterales bacterium]|nr:MmgE/PrpD family protein [Bryobacterales bacterium]